MASRARCGFPSTVRGDKGGFQHASSSAAKTRAVAAAGEGGAHGGPEAAVDAVLGQLALDVAHLVRRLQQARVGLEIEARADRLGWR
eukprot:2418838-Prymnesium_polylepis.1